MKEKFGSRKALLDKIVELDGRAKDSDYRRRFERWPTPRLWDYFRAAEKRS